MIEIADKDIEKNNWFYRPECRHLVGGQIDFPSIRGNFEIPRSFYIAEGINSGHFNAVDLLLCYNQLSYVFLTEAMKRGLIPEIGKIEEHKLREYQLMHSVIVAMNNIRFRRPINPRSFEGIITLDKVTPKERIIFLKTSFDFENGKQTGEIDLGLIK